VATVALYFLDVCTRRVQALVESSLSSHEVIRSVLVEMLIVIATIQTHLFTFLKRAALALGRTASTRVVR
jgi:hypothetical protein